MAELLQQDAKVLAFVLGLVAQAAITWWRVQAMDRDVASIKQQLAELNILKGRVEQEHDDFDRRIDHLERRVFNR